MLAHNALRILLLCGCVLAPAGASGVGNRLEVRSQTNSAMGFDASLWRQAFRPEQPDADLHTHELPTDELRAAEPSAQSAPVTPDTETRTNITPQQRLMAVRVDVPAPFVDIDPSLLPVRLSAPIKRKSAWDQARLAAISDPLSEHTVGSGGPSTTTLLVGLVAGIVFLGAIFSGKE